MFKILDIENFNCDSCPASYLKVKQIEKIKSWKKTRDDAIKFIKQVNLFLLGESIPYKRFFMLK